MRPCVWRGRVTPYSTSPLFSLLARLQTVRYGLSCDVGMSHATYEWITSHLNESCPVSSSLLAHLQMVRYGLSYDVGMSHVTYERVTSHMNESCPVFISLWARLKIVRSVMWRRNEFYHIWHLCEETDTHMCQGEFVSRYVSSDTLNVSIGCAMCRRDRYTYVGETSTYMCLEIQISWDMCIEIQRDMCLEIHM